MAERIYNGMSAGAVPGAAWRKSTYSNPSGNCVETAHIADGRVAVRDSWFPEGAALVCSGGGFRAFIAGVKLGRPPGDSRRAG